MHEKDGFSTKILEKAISFSNWLVRRWCGRPVLTNGLSALSFVLKVRVFGTFDLIPLSWNTTATDISADNFFQEVLCFERVKRKWYSSISLSIYIRSCSSCYLGNKTSCSILTSDCRVASTLVWGTVSVSTDLVWGLGSFLVEWGPEELIGSFLGEEGRDDSLRGDVGLILPAKNDIFHSSVHQLTLTKTSSCSVRIHFFVLLHQTSS